MKCMYCGYTESKVIDSRSTDEGRTIRRRRECMQCGKRFTTYETIETTPVLVVKNGGNRQAFDPNKIKNGIIKAQIYNSLEQEITSKQIGEMVMEGLRQIDEVAYVRYASVYRSFTDISSFMSELETLMQEGKIKKTDRKDEE